MTTANEQKRWVIYSRFRDEAAGGDHWRKEAEFDNEPQANAEYERLRRADSQDGRKMLFSLECHL